MRQPPTGRGSKRYAPYAHRDEQRSGKRSSSSSPVERPARSVSDAQLMRACALRGLADEASGGSHAFYTLVSPIVHGNETNKKPWNWTRPEVPAWHVDGLLGAVEAVLRTPTGGVPPKELGPTRMLAERAAAVRRRMGLMGDRGNAFLRTLDQVTLGRDGRASAGGWAEAARTSDVAKVVASIERIGHGLGWLAQ